jgi:ParB/RepB/Spo0J family partition protein
VYPAPTRGLNLLKEKSMTTTTDTTNLAVELASIYVPANVRDLDDTHVDALAQSIALQGLLSPVTIAPADALARDEGFDHVLVAGFHRHAAVRRLQHHTIDAVLRADDESDEQLTAAAIAAARATENIARKQLNPYEEAVAVQAMLDSGLSLDGTAQALGWSKAKVTVRSRLLELPVSAQRLIGDGLLGVASIDTLRGIGAVSPEILDVLVNYLAASGPGAARFTREPGFILNDAIRSSQVFGAYLQNTDGRAIEILKLGKRATENYAQVTELEQKLNRYAYGQPRVPFSEADVDQARAAGVLIELPGTLPIVVDRGVYRELAKAAIKRRIGELTDQIAANSANAKADRAAGAAERLAVDPIQTAKREHGREVRQLAQQAHSANVDLGWSLRNGLSVVDPDDMNVARFFAHVALGADYHDGYGNAGERVAELAMTGIRLVIEEFRTDVTKTRKDNTRGALRMSYGDPRKPEPAIQWLWKYIDAAKTAGELYGRTLVVIAAQQYASRLVVPSSQQHPAIRWGSHQDKAAKALAKLAGPYLPASLKQLEKAVTKAKAQQDKTVTEIRSAQKAEAAQKHATATDSSDEADGLDEFDDKDVDGLED